MDLQAEICQLRNTLEARIIGQQQLVQRLLMALLCDGHLLVEGAPGLAKTRAIRALADVVEGDFQRIQFTPDLLPGDITGTDIYRPETGEFEFQRGPVFHNLILADEINRAPAKVQSALLEAMAEKQVSVGHHSYALPGLFLVMATQNPIEQEGTYPLPEAQLDRFLLHVELDYPAADAELEIMRLVRSELRSQAQPQAAAPVLSWDRLQQVRTAVLAVHMAEAIEQYIVQLVAATRDGRPHDRELNDWLSYGASPRASLALDRCARAQAWLAGRDYVNPDDVQQVAHDVLRHRIIPSFHAEAEGIDANRIIDRLLERVPVA